MTTAEWITASLVFIIAAIHGNVRDALWLIQKHQITHRDILVLLGDVGLNYYGNDQGDKKRKRLLDSAGVPILCIHGNHEERPFNIQSYGEIFYVYDLLDLILSTLPQSVEIAILIGGHYCVTRSKNEDRGGFIAGIQSFALASFFCFQ